MTSPMHSPLQSPLQPVMRSPLEHRRGVSSFDPASLYAGGKKGYTFDLIDKSKLFQNPAGTGAITADSDPIGYAADLSGNGFHATQGTGGSRPLYSAANGATGTGTEFLDLPTVDLSSVTQLTVICCVKTNTAGNQGVWEHGSFNAGDASILMNSGQGNVYTSTLRGVSDSPYVNNARGGLSNDFKVVTAIFDREALTASEQVKTRINGEVYGGEPSDGGLSGSANFASRVGKLMNWYGGTCLIGALARVIVIEGLLSADLLYKAERWVGEGGGLSLITEFPPAGTSYYSLINSYGQSLSTGVSNPATVISDASRFGDVMFSSGIHVLANGLDFSALIPLVESTAVESASTEGETVVSGTAELVHEMGYSNKFIGVTTGFPALTIAQLSQGQTSYNNFLSAVTSGMRRSREQFKHFKVRAFQWMQGESDGGNASYAANMNTLRGTLDTDIKTITGQPEDVWMLTYQLDWPKIGLAHLAASDNYSNIRVAMPMYHLPHYDGVHLTSLGYKIAGAYFGKAYNEVIVSGNTAWQPLRALSSSVAGAVCDVVFNPVGSLVFDTTIVAAQTNYGFKLFQSDGTTAITISSVEIVGTDTVRITASAAIPAGAILRYGFSDPAGTSQALGNLRDSQGDTLVFDGGGINYPLHNWCVLFQKTA